MLGEGHGKKGNGWQNIITSTDLNHQASYGRLLSPLLHHHPPHELRKMVRAWMTVILQNFEKGRECLSITTPGPEQVMGHYLSHHDAEDLMSSS